MQIVWMGVLLALGGLAYRELVFFEPGAGLSNELQAWLLTPADTAPSVVLALAAWLVIRRRDVLARLPRRGGPVALTASLLGGGTAVLAWASFVRAPDLLVISLVLTTLGLASLFWGAPGIRVLRLPAAFLLFALPIPAPLLNQVVFPFQLWTAEIAGWLLYAAGIPALVAGDQILRDQFTFTIVEGCSGLRTVETLTMLVVLMLDLFRRRGLHAWLLFLAAPCVGFAVNSLRVIFLILLPLAETVTIHNLQGIVMLLMGLMLLYWLDGLLERILPTSSGPPAQGRDSAALSPATPWVAAAVLGLASLLSFGVPAWDPPRPLSPGLAVRVPRDLDDWSVTQELKTDRVFLGRVAFAQSIDRRYRRGRDEVDLFVGLADPTDRLSDPFSPKTLRPGSGWIVEEEGLAKVGPEGRDVDSRLLRSGSGSHRVLVYHWTDGTRGFGSELFRHMLGLDGSPLRRKQEGVVVRLATEIGEAGERERRRAERRLDRFATAAWDVLVPLGNGAR